jgi:hypothetical protein
MLITYKYVDEHIDINIHQFVFPAHFHYVHASHMPMYIGCSICTVITHCAASPVA